MQSIPSYATHYTDGWSRRMYKFTQDVRLYDELVKWHASTDEGVTINHARRSSQFNKI